MQRNDSIGSKFDHLKKKFLNFMSLKLLAIPTIKFKSEFNYGFII